MINSGSDFDRFYWKYKQFLHNCITLHSSNAWCCSVPTVRRQDWRKVLARWPCAALRTCVWRQHSSLLTGALFNVWFSVWNLPWSLNMMSDCFLITNLMTASHIQIIIDSTSGSGDSVQNNHVIQITESYSQDFFERYTCFTIPLLF